MIAVRVGADWWLLVVGSPDYFEQNSPPATPHHITDHQCINIRHRAGGSIYAWEFVDGDTEYTVRGDGRLVFNSMSQVIQSAIDGLGLAYVPEPLVLSLLKQGRLSQILTDHCPYFSGYHLYYPNRRQASPAFSAFVDALRYRQSPA